jgi:SH3-like domain-containing protein
MQITANRGNPLSNARMVMTWRRYHDQGGFSGWMAACLLGHHSWSGVVYTSKSHHVCVALSNVGNRIAMRACFFVEEQQGTEILHRPALQSEICLLA